MIFISHDLSIVRYISNNIAVMRQSTIVEYGPTNTLFISPTHPTSAIPHLPKG